MSRDRNIDGSGCPWSNRSKRIAVLVVVLFAISHVTWANVDLTSEAKIQCGKVSQSDLSGLPEAPTQITDSELVPGSQSQIAYCSVKGYVLPQVGFEVRLPLQGWNGKLIQVGSNGHGGVLWGDSCAPFVQRGYSCVVSDMGHRGTGWDGVWARDNLQGKLDWGYRATHVVTLAAKAVVRNYYRREPAHSYFSGCSTGGRQALQEAQRFPWDYDGIIAGAPPIRLADLYVTFAWSALANRDPAGKMLLSREDLALLTKAAVAKCDLDDGVKDGIISQPLRCPFSPSELACTDQKHSGCLSDVKVAAAAKIYSGPTDSTGKIGRAHV